MPSVQLMFDTKYPQEDLLKFFFDANLPKFKELNAGPSL
jgi:hypothetical protein